MAWLSVLSTSFAVLPGASTPYQVAY
jgi:hypothetical protein